MKLSKKGFETLMPFGEYFFIGPNEDINYDGDYFEDAEDFKDRIEEALQAALVGPDEVLMEANSLLIPVEHRDTEEVLRITSELCDYIQFTTLIYYRDENGKLYFGIYWE